MSNVKCQTETVPYGMSRLDRHLIVHIIMFVGITVYLGISLPFGSWIQSEHLVDSSGSFRTHFAFS